MRYRSEIERADFMAVAVTVRDIEVRASGEGLRAAFERLYEDLRQGRAGGDDRRRQAVRDILRNGRYRPSGRSKPAQEYLSRVWSTQGAVDLINNAVDVNNLFSLRNGLPVSAFDLGAIRGDLTIRLGREDESFVFNAAGQVLDCHDLLVVCDDRGPIGSPVKDSQDTKLFPGATSVVYVVYTSRQVMTERELLDASTELGDLMLVDCATASVEPPLLFMR
jgi:DNA/RNA-binding domain of Phe-tRNA-synthetase-like protein